MAFINERGCVFDMSRHARKTIIEYCVHFSVPDLVTSGAVPHWSTGNGIGFCGRFDNMVTTPTVSPSDDQNRGKCGFRLGENWEHFSYHRNQLIAIFGRYEQVLSNYCN